MIYILDCGSSKTKFIHQMVDEYMECTTIPFFDFKNINLTDAIGVIISGALILITEEDMKSYLEASAWIKRFQCLLLGICFGHQFYWVHFGSLANKNERR